MALNRKSFAERRMLRENRDAIRELDEVTSDAGQNQPDRPNPREQARAQRALVRDRAKGWTKAEDAAEMMDALKGVHSRLDAKSSMPSRGTVYVDGREVARGEVIVPAMSDARRGDHEVRMDPAGDAAALREKNAADHRAEVRDVYPVPGQVRVKLPTAKSPEVDRESTQVHRVEDTKVMSDLDRRLAKLPTVKTSSPDLGPTI